MNIHKEQVFDKRGPARYTDSKNIKSENRVWRIIREELLFEKIPVIIVNSGILNNSSRIIFYFLFRNPGILFLTSFTSALPENQVSFHSLSFLSTESCDISA